MPDTTHTLVLGGGIAGLAAAVRLAQAGVRVTLVETRRRLGGRATSFDDPQTGLTLDNCQHVLLGCCTNLLDLYDRLGVTDHVTWHDRMYFADLAPPTPPTPPTPNQAPATGDLDTAAIPIDRLDADPLPAPLHTARSLLSFRMLTWGEKLAISWGMLGVMRAGRRGRAKVSQMTFLDWLRRHRQPASAIDKFWAPIAIGAINERPDRMSAAHALQVFQEGFLANRASYRMGLSATPLVGLYDAAERVIEEAGGRVLMGRSVEGIEFDEGQHRVTGAVVDGDSMACDACISALPFDRLAKVCPPAMTQADARLQRLDALSVSPILGIHLWLAEPDPAAPVMSLPHLSMMRSELHWIFNKGRMDAAALAGLSDAAEPDCVADGEAGRTGDAAPIGGLRHLHGVISAAHAWVDQPAQAIVEMAMGELRRVLPSARDAALVHSRVIKEKRATFSATPEVEPLRPAAAGAIANLFLAGDWCQSGWPATMEGAARSGYLAAAALQAQKQATSTAATPPAPSLAKDLPPGWLYRLLAFPDA